MIERKPEFRLENFIRFWQELNKPSQSSQIPSENIKSHFIRYINHLFSQSHYSDKILVDQLKLLENNNHYPDLNLFLSKICSDMQDNSGKKLKAFIFEETDGEYSQFIDILNNQISHEKEEKQILPDVIQAGQNHLDRTLYLVPDKTESNSNIILNLYILGSNQFCQHDFKAAENTFKKAIGFFDSKPEPKQARIRIFLGRVFTEMNRYMESAEQWKEAKIILDDLSQAGHNVTHLIDQLYQNMSTSAYLHAEQFYKEEKYHDAESLYLDSLELQEGITEKSSYNFADSSHAWMSLAGCYLGLDKIYEAWYAIKNAKMMLDKIHKDHKVFKSVESRLNNKYIRLYFDARYLGHKNLYQNKFSEAEALYRIAIDSLNLSQERGPEFYMKSWYIRNDLGEVLFEQKQCDLALREFLSILNEMDQYAENIPEKYENDCVLFKDDLLRNLVQFKISQEHTFGFQKKYLEAKKCIFDGIHYGEAISEKFDTDRIYLASNWKQLGKINLYFKDADTAIEDFDVALELLTFISDKKKESREVLFKDIMNQLFSAINYKTEEAKQDEHNMFYISAEQNFRIALFWFDRYFVKNPENYYSYIQLKYNLAMVLTKQNKYTESCLLFSELRDQMTEFAKNKKDPEFLNDCKQQLNLIERALIVYKKLEGHALRLFKAKPLELEVKHQPEFKPKMT